MQRGSWGAQMAAWSEFAAAEPAFAERVQRILDGHIHKTIATLRRDGSPRISGTEATIVDGELWLGGGTASVKVRDMLRDPRVAIHGAPVDQKMVDGDAKLSGRAIHEDDDARLTRAFPERPAGATFLRLDIDEAVVTWVADNQLLLELWTPAEGLRRLPTA